MNNESLLDKIKKNSPQLAVVGITLLAWWIAPKFISPEDQGWMKPIMISALVIAACLVVYNLFLGVKRK